MIKSPVVVTPVIHQEPSVKYEPMREMGSIVRKLAKQYGVSPREIRGECRQKHLVEIRHKAMYMAYKTGRYSLATIGRYFGGRDHTSILHAVQKMGRRNGK